MKTRIETVPHASLKLDTRLQSREAINADKVREYADAMQEQAFPPLRAVRVDGVLYVVDGWHRWHAAQEIGLLELEAEIGDSTFDDALLLAVGANATHGMQRTTADKRKAVMILLDHPEHGSSSDRQIAELAKVTHPFVGNVRKSLEPVSSVVPETVRTVLIGNVSNFDSTVNLVETEQEQQPEAQSVLEIGRKIKDDQPVEQVLDAHNRELQRQNAELTARLLEANRGISDSAVGRKLSEAIVEIRRLEDELRDKEENVENAEGRISNLVAEVERLSGELTATREKLLAAETLALERNDRNRYLVGLLNENGIGFDPAKKVSKPALSAPAALPPQQASARSNECEPRWRGDQAKLIGVAKDKPARGRQADDDD